MNFVKDPQTDTPLVGNFESFGEAFVAAAAMFFDVEAYVQGERRMTYGDWFAAADALAANLVNLGVKPGAVVLIALESSIDFAVCYAAVLLAGGITSGVNVRLGPREVDAIVERSQARLIILEDSASLPANPPAVEVGKIRLDPRRREVFRGKHRIEVTSLEFDILDVLMRSAGHIVSREKLAADLCRKEFTASQRFIDVHISHLRRKLETGAQPLIRSIRGVGYLFVPAEEHEE